MAPIIQISLGVFTVLASGVFSAIVTYNLNKRRQDLEFRRTKLELCFDSAHRFINNLTTSNIPYVDALTNKYTWDEATDMIMNSQSENDRDHWLNIEKIINIYFPDLTPQLDRLIELKKLLWNCKESARKAYLGKSRLTETKDNYLFVLDQLHDLDKAFKQSIYKLAKSL